MTYHRICHKSNTTGAICGEGTAYLSGVPEVIPNFSGVRIVRSLVSYVVFYTSMLVLFQTTIYKTLHRKLSNTKPIKIGGELTCSVMVGCSCSTCGTHRGTLFTS